MCAPPFSTLRSSMSTVAQGTASFLTRVHFGTNVRTSRWDQDGNFRHFCGEKGPKRIRRSLVRLGSFPERKGARDSYRITRTESVFSLNAHHGTNVERSHLGIVLLSGESSSISHNF